MRAAWVVANGMRLAQAGTAIPKEWFEAVCETEEEAAGRAEDDAWAKETAAAKHEWRR